MDFKVSGIGKEPFFSLIGASIHLDKWKLCYNSISNKNNIPFELIFVGPYTPNFKLPTNLRFIRSNVKPSQCVEIAARKAKGKYLFPIADDVVLSSRFLNKLYEHIERIKDPLSFFSPIFKENYIKYIYNKKLKFIKECPKVSCVSIYNAKKWREIGGIDRNFVATYWNYDIQFRLYKMGGNNIFIKNIICNELTYNKNKKHLNRYASYDKRFLSTLWRNSQNKYFSKQRQLPFKPFFDKRIKKKSQGKMDPLKRWK